MALYDTIGKTYTSTRKADPRITEKIIKYLDIKPPATITDIGAGTGNYTQKLAEYGFKIIAIEPSAVMRKQAKKHPNIDWVEGYAESLPLDDNSVNGSVCIGAIHNFSDLQKAFEEMNRVTKKRGSIVIFTADPSLRDKDCWLDKYFSPFNQSWFLPIKKVATLLGNATKTKVEIKVFMIPHDLVDGVFVSGWRRPNLYLDDSFCEGISSLAKAPKNELRTIQKKLKKDLKSGAWDEKYGYMKKLKEYDGGYRFLVAKKS